MVCFWFHTSSFALVRISLWHAEVNQMKLQFPHESDEPQTGANTGNHISRTALWCVGTGINLEKSKQRATQTMHMSWESTAGVDYYRLLMLVCLLLWQGKYSMSPFCNAHRSLLEPGWEWICTVLCALNFGKKNGSLCVRCTHVTVPQHIYVPHMMFRSVWPTYRQNAFWSSQRYIHENTHRQHIVTCYNTSTEKPSAPGSHAFFLPLWCEHLHHVVKCSRHLNTLPLQLQNGGGTKQNTAPATWAKGALVTGPKS